MEDHQGQQCNRITAAIEEEVEEVEPIIKH
jgi:hypothetical protein